MGLQKTVFGRSKYKPNTFIGGISATINTPALIAAKLDVSVTRIKAFSVIGSDIQFAVINGTYAIGVSPTFTGSSLTYFKDNDGLLTKISKDNYFSGTQATEFYLPNLVSANHRIFYNNSKVTKIYTPKLKEMSHSGALNCPLLVDVDMSSLENFGGQDFENNTSLVTLNLPKLVSMPYYCCRGNTKLKYFTSSVVNINDIQNFANCTSIELIDIPKCVKLGSSPATNTGQFTNIKMGCVINVNIALQTANSGAPDADLQYAITSRGAIVNYIP